MKKTMILSATLAAALFVAPLAACGSSGTTTKIKENGKKVNLMDYAAPVSELDTESDAFIKTYTDEATLLDGRFEKLGGSNSRDWLLKHTTKDTGGNNVYGLYNAFTDAEVASGCTAINALSSAQLSLTSGGSYFLNFFTAEKDSKYSVYAPTGDALVQGAYSVTSDFSVTQKSFFNGNTELTAYYRFSYKTSEEGDTQFKYYRLTVDLEDFSNSKAESLAVDVYEEESEKGPYEADSSTPVAGDVLAPETHNLLAMTTDEEELEDVKETYLASSLKDWSISRTQAADTVITFYKNGEKANSLSLKSAYFNVGSGIAFTEQYMYYTEAVPVSQDAVSGYNLEVYNSYGDTCQKSDVTLYRYDFTKGGEPKALKTNFVPAYLVSYYNYTTNQFDAIGCAALGMNNGVAVSRSGFDYTLLLDQDGKVSKDLSDKAVNFASADVYKLSDTRLYSDSDKCIYDENLDVIADLSGYTVDYTVVHDAANSAFLAFNKDARTYCYVDYDGKLIFDAIYTYSLTMIDGVAVDGISSTSVTPPWASSNYMLYSKANPSGVLLSELLKNETSDEETAYKLNWQLGLFLLSATKDEATTVKAFDVTGSEVASFANTSIVSGTVTVYGGAFVDGGRLEMNEACVLLSANVQDGENTVQKTIAVR